MSNFKAKHYRTVRKITEAKTDTEAIDKASDNEIWNVLMSIKGKGNITDIYGRCQD